MASAIRILIAEDEPFIVESLTFLLTREGFTVHAVSDGGAALHHVSADPPDLLVLDAMIPVSNGFDVLRRIRGTPALAKLPVMVLTAKGQEADRQRMLDLGADDFVTKPFSNADLIARVNRLVSPQSPAEPG